MPGSHRGKSGGDSVQKSINRINKWLEDLQRIDDGRHDPDAIYDTDRDMTYSQRIEELKNKISETTAGLESEISRLTEDHDGDELFNRDTGITYAQRIEEIREVIATTGVVMADRELELRPASEVEGTPQTEADEPPPFDESDTPNNAAPESVTLALTADESEPNTDEPATDTKARVSPPPKPDPEVRVEAGPASPWARPDHKPDTHEDMDEPTDSPGDTNTEGAQAGVNQDDEVVEGEIVDEEGQPSHPEGDHKNIKIIGEDLGLLAGLKVAYQAFEGKDPDTDKMRNNTWHIARDSFDTRPGIPAEVFMLRQTKVDEPNVEVYMSPADFRPEKDRGNRIHILESRGADGHPLTSGGILSRFGIRGREVVRRYSRPADILISEQLVNGKRGHIEGEHIPSDWPEYIDALKRVARSMVTTVGEDFTIDEGDRHIINTHTEGRHQMMEGRGENTQDMAIDLSDSELLECVTDEQGRVEGTHIWPGGEGNPATAEADIKLAHPAEGRIGRRVEGIRNKIRDARSTQELSTHGMSAESGF